MKKDLNNYITDEKVNNIINSVISGINDKWPTIYKIRYIYLEIGKRLYRDTDFFFSVDGKLGEDNLSISQIKEIYNNYNGRNLKVICKSASYILKTAYDRVGIKSKLVETNTTIAAVSDEEEFLVNHWMLVIYDGDKAYFATLTPDLPYIQMNMATKHFASDIPYMREFNGKVMQVYKGEEIKPSLISRNKLKDIDIDIGYINKSYHYNNKGQIDNEWFLQYDNAALYMLRDNLKNNKLFYELEINETSFYKNLTKFMGENDRNISFTDTDMNYLTKEDWNIWIKLLCQQVLERINDILGYEIDVLPNLESPYWNYESWLFNLCVQIQNDLFKMLSDNKQDNFSDVFVDIENFKYNKWSKKVKSKFGKGDRKFNHDNILLILDKMNSLINCVNSNGKNGKFNELFFSLGYHFIDSTHLYENNISEDGYLQNYYIANKFNKLFRRIFSCNEMITKFNYMGYSEKIAIIKDILFLMFPEINKKNSYKLKDYNDNYNAVLNRIQLYSIKNKYDGYYSILFNILGDEKNDDYYFFYNARKNIFKISNALDIYSDYIIVSNRMKNRISIEDLEMIEEPFDKKRKK